MPPWQGCNSDYVHRSCPDDDQIWHVQHCPETTASSSFIEVCPVARAKIRKRKGKSKAKSNGDPGLDMWRRKRDWVNAGCRPSFKSKHAFADHCGCVECDSVRATRKDLELVSVKDLEEMIREDVNEIEF
jgi:hypothetical protein